MTKKHFSGIYKNASEITPEHLLEFYLAGDVNRDMYIDFEDVAELANRWLESF